MKAILVDDESLALRDLERQIKKTGQLDVIGTFQDGESALAAASEHIPDIAFLDIDMPELSGMELAELLQNRLPSIDIVFVTGYEEYAVKAFELNALDYIVKPVLQERLLRTLTRLVHRPPPAVTASEATTGMIKCFQYLHFDIAKPGTIQWRTTRAQELFAYLVHRRLHPVRKDVLIELLWPETDAHKGYTQLYTAIYQIRKMLRTIGLPIRIVSSDNGYRVDLNGMKLDIEEWERGLQDAPPVSRDTISHHITLSDQYQGDYLIDHDYSWADGERERLRTLWYHHAVALGNVLVENERLADAVLLYSRVQSLFPNAEELYFILMKLYDQCKDWVSVEKQYAALHKMMSEEFDAEPLPHISAWHHEWKKSRKQYGSEYFGDTAPALG
ncbi:response regulator [Paenibacillus piri]|uniref:Response regulator n=1 Tax=Paenibacillus piri TaxID=2547395 RepID=A0A4R5KNK9_9BACL|nr:response regulator [Paenibacillus piri]TDF97231.1 response regulator [Paenibacillus piri]